MINSFFRRARKEFIRECLSEAIPGIISSLILIAVIFIDYVFFKNASFFPSHGIYALFHRIYEIMHGVYILTLYIVFSVAFNNTALIDMLESFYELIQTLIYSSKIKKIIIMLSKKFNFVSINESDITDFDIVIETDDGIRILKFQYNIWRRKEHLKRDFVNKYYHLCWDKIYQLNTYDLTDEIYNLIIKRDEESYVRSRNLSDAIESTGKAVKFITEIKDYDIDEYDVDEYSEEFLNSFYKLIEDLSSDNHKSIRDLYYNEFQEYIDKLILQISSPIKKIKQFHQRKPLIIGASIYACANLNHRDLDLLSTLNSDISISMNNIYLDIFDKEERYSFWSVTYRYVGKGKPDKVVHDTRDEIFVMNRAITNLIIQDFLRVFLEKYYGLDVNHQTER